jgi:hypothetical protein
MNPKRGGKYLLLRKLNVHWDVHKSPSLVLENQIEFLINTVKNNDRLH